MVYHYRITLYRENGETLQPSDENYKNFYQNLYENLEKCVKGNETKFVYEIGKDNEGFYTVNVSHADSVFIQEILDRMVLTSGSYEMYHNAFTDMLRAIKHHFGKH